MKKYTEFEQGSFEWLQMKWAKIGGTLGGGLFVNSDTLMIDILSQRLEEFQPDYGYENAAMIRGSELEPEGVGFLNLYTGLKFESVGWLQCELNELLGISPDGITATDKEACEIKCPERKEHTETILADEIPKKHIKQCVHYFIVNPKLERLFFCSFRPESVKNFVKKLTLDSDVDLGWTKKIKVTRPNAKGVDYDYTEIVPDIKTVREWVKIARNEADILLAEIQVAENKLRQNF